MNLMYEDRDEAGLRTTGISPLQWGAFPRPIRGRHLIGTVMDYREDKLTRGFTFENPNEKGRCGCGESFHV